MHLHRPPSVLSTEGTIHSSVSMEKYESLKKKKDMRPPLPVTALLCVPEVFSPSLGAEVQEHCCEERTWWSGCFVNWSFSGVFCGIYEFPFQKLCRCVAVPVYPSPGSTYSSVESQSTPERVLGTKRKPLLSEKTLWEELCPKPQNLVLLSCDNFVRL